MYDYRKISKAKSPKANLIASMEAIESYFQPHQFAHVLAQVMHESGGLIYDREIWGPTAQQKKYERDFSQAWSKTNARNKLPFTLGNSEKGDGSKYRGYGPIQVTGRGNVTRFRDWCRKEGLNPPDFVKDPAKIAEAPWAGWSVVWYWQAGNPEGKTLNRYADINDIEMITRRVNGGLNGYGDRLGYYDRAALVILGYGPTDIRAFQSKAGIKADGISGPQTRAELHKALVKIGNVAEPGKVKPSPVTVAPPSLEKPWYQSKEVIAPIITGGGLTGGATLMESFGRVPWQNMLILVGVAVAGLIAYQLYSRRKDQKAVGVQ